MTVPALILSLLFFCTGGLEDPEQKTAAFFESIRDNPIKLRAFFKEMPLGGDIHHHLSGSVWAEDIVEIALKHQLCADDGWFLTLPPCGSGTRSFASIQPAEYRRALEAWSLKGMDPGSPGAEQRFFKIFPRIGNAATRTSDALPYLLKRAAAEGVTYLETMTRAREAREVLSRLEKNWGPREDWDSFYRELSNDPLFQEACQLATAAYPKHMETLQPIITKTGVQVRFIYQIHRHVEPFKVFISAALAFRVAHESPYVAGLTMVGPETHYYSWKHYKEHMAMLAFFRKKFPEVPITLHAGEFRPGTIPPESGAHHIRDALEIVKPERIGHGTNIGEDRNYQTLLKGMARDKILLETAPSSNELLLGITQPHPIQLYMQQGVPIALATDDAGIFRTDLTEQFVLAARRNPGFTYAHFKQFARNSLEFSFLEGRSLWAEKGVYETRAFQEQNRHDYLGKNLKARLQWQLEKSLSAFEKKMARQ